MESGKIVHVQIKLRPLEENASYTRLGYSSSAQQNYSFFGERDAGANKRGYSLTSSVVESSDEDKNIRVIIVRSNRRENYITSVAEISEVIVADSYVKPEIKKSVPVFITSQSEANKLKKSSSYEQGKVDKFTRREIKSILKDKVFRKEANAIYKDSVKAKRELDALSIYQNAMTGDYYVYSVGTPSEVKANRMAIEPVDPSKGRHVFDWHPHPWGNDEPSPKDLKTSFDREVPGVIKYGEKLYDRNIYIGICKVEATCD